MIKFHFMVTTFLIKKVNNCIEWFETAPDKLKYMTVFFESCDRKAISTTLKRSFKNQKYFFEFYQDQFNFTRATK